MASRDIHPALQRPALSVSSPVSGALQGKVIDSDPAYFRAAGLYILLNPVDAGLVDLRKDELKSYRWSAYADYIKPPSKRPDWLRT